MPQHQERRALYLRWRPQTFEDVVGQEHVTRTLRNAVRGGRLGHAYLLCGPRGTGKTSLARILYRAANCADPVDGEPCGSCPTCRAALAGQAMDLVEVDAASNRGIDDIRQLRERVVYAPSEGRFRVYIIDEAHELTTPAWDAFLKTLEEPPPHTIFVLATTEAHKVPATIVSRCQRFDLRRISFADIRGHLTQIAAAEGMQAEPSVLDCLARLARGGLRDALSLLDQLHAYAGDQLDMAAARTMLGIASVDAVRGFVESLEGQDAAAALDTLAGVVDEGIDLRQFLGEVVAYLRGLLLARGGSVDALRGDFSAEDLEWLQTRASRWPADRLLSLTRSLADGLARLRDALQLELHVELALLESCAGASMPATEAGSRASRSPSSSPLPSAADPSPPAAQSIAPPSLQTPDPPTTAPVAVPPPEPPVEVPGAGEAVPDAERAANEPTSSVPPLATTTEQADLDLAGLRRRWPAVMERLRGSNGVVAAMLEAAHLAGIDAAEVRLSFEYAFHQRQVSELRNRRLVEDTLAEVIGRQLRVTCLHQPPQTAPLGEQDFAVELDRLIAEDPVLRRAVDLWGRHLTIVE